MFLLDTNVVSELRKAKAGNADCKVTRWAKDTSTLSLFISVITVLELEMGVLQIERRDPIQGAMLREWLNQHVMPAFQNRILPIDEPVARQYARFHIPDPMSERDALIAATAQVHHMTVVTRNALDFQSSGISLLNPWD
jgi:predicted nucleic acid-binding protein